MIVNLTIVRYRTALNPFAHLDVINRVREENWFTEDLFVRFRPIDSFGTLNGADPVKSLLTGKGNF